MLTIGSICDGTESYNRAVNAIIADINFEISLFNLSPVTANKTQEKKSLREIQKLLDALMANYKNFFVSPELNQRIASIRYTLIPNLYKFGLIEECNKVQDNELPEIIAELSEYKLQKFIHIIANEKAPQNLKNLYEPDDKTLEAENFREFLTTHSFCYIKSHTTCPLKITNINTNKAYLLKIEKDCIESKTYEQQIRAGNLSDMFTKQYLSRFTLIKGHRPRFISVYEWCQKGDLLTFCEYKNGNVKKYVSSVLDYAIKMANDLLRLQEQNILFADAKDVNWLLKDDGIKIGDLKSFLASADDGTYLLPKGYRKDHRSLIITPFYAPPELSYKRKEGTLVDIDKAHVFLLGRSIKDLLNRFHKKIYDAIGVNKRNSDNKYILNLPMYKSLRYFVEQLTCDDPSCRPTLKQSLCSIYYFHEEINDKFEALKQTMLFAYSTQYQEQIRSLKSEIDSTLKEGNFDKLRDYVDKFNNKPLYYDLKKTLDKLYEFTYQDDKLLNDFISNKLKEIAIALDEGQEDKALTKYQELKECSQLIAKDKLIKQICSDIQRLKKGVSFISIGKAKKAQEIAKALAEIPIPYRLNLYEHRDKKEVKNLIRVLDKPRMSSMSIFCIPGMGVCLPYIEHQHTKAYHEFQQVLYEEGRAHGVSAKTT